MGPPSYMRSVVDRNVVIRRMSVTSFSLSTAKQGPSQKKQETEGPCYRKCLTGALQDV